jgi:hypothetical protein
LEPRAAEAGQGRVIGQRADERRRRRSGRPREWPENASRADARNRAIKDSGGKVDQKPIWRGLGRFQPVRARRAIGRDKAESRRQQAVEQNGPLGYPDTESDLEDDEPLPLAASNDPGKPDGSATHGDLARKFLSLAGMSIDRLEQAAQGGIQPLPEQDERVTALRRLVPMVSDDIGASLTDVLDRVTGEYSA